MRKGIHTSCRHGSWSRLLVLVLLVPVMLAGCSGSRAQVSGKVTYKGAPVKGGTLVFAPLGDKNPGKAATAEVQNDGTYTLGTNSPGDGALVGSHHVSYTSPDPELTEKQRTDPNYIAPPSPYGGLVPKQTEVQVQSGTNSIDIELVPAPPKMIQP